MSNTVKAVFAVVVLGLAGVMLVRYFTAARGDGEDMPEGTFWLCQNAECQAEFPMSLRKVKKARNADGAVPCPECNKSLTTRALQCPNCKRPYPPVGHGDRREICPNCNEKIPPPEAWKKLSD